MGYIMARWVIKNVGMKGVAMAVPENVVKTSDFDFFFSGRG